MANLVSSITHLLFTSMDYYKHSIACIYKHNHNAIITPKKVNSDSLISTYVQYLNFLNRLIHFLYEVYLIRSHIKFTHCNCLYACQVFFDI